MERYPYEILPAPLLREGAFQQVENLYMDPMGGGNFKSRNKWPDDVPTIKEFVWRFRKPQAAFFVGWWTHVLGSKSTPFEMNVPTELGIILHECRFISSPLESVTQLSQMLWEYRARVVIKRRAVMDQDTIIEAYFAPYDLEELVARWEASMTSYVE